jgi:serine/threonine-protein kinase
MNDAAQKRVGSLLRGKYQIEAILGSGGMGDVFRATHTRLGRPVAVKILRTDAMNDPEVVERFLQEGRAAYHVRHPNVVEVIDVDTDEAGVPFIVLEYLEGQDLGSVLNDRVRLSAQETIEIVEPIARAVGEAHRKGLVHRDIKPENVFLCRSGESWSPKLVDFGVSKLETTDFKRTSVPLLVGTPPFMSPEQISAPDTVDARSDVWALGVVMYTTLSGRLPFDGETITAIFTKICYDDPAPLDDLVASLPATLVAIVRRCLSRDADHRFQNGSELADALGSIGKKTVPAPRAAPRWLTPRPMVPMGWGDLDLAPKPAEPVRAPPAKRAAASPERASLDPDFVKVFDPNDLVPDMPRRSAPRPPPRSRPAPERPHVHDLSIADVIAGSVLGVAVAFIAVRARTDWLVSVAEGRGGSLFVAGGGLVGAIVLAFVIVSLASLAARKGSAALGLASLGLIGFTVSVGLSALAIALPRLPIAAQTADIVPIALPLCGVAVTLGLSVHAAKKAIEALRSSEAPAKNFGVVLALVSFVGFVATIFVGYQAAAALAT